MTPEFRPEKPFAHKFWAYLPNRSGRVIGQIGPYTTRDEAVTAGLAQWPKARAFSTGFGEQGAYFDIRSTDAAAIHFAQAVAA